MAATGITQGIAAGRTSDDGFGFPAPRARFVPCDVAVPIPFVAGIADRLARIGARVDRLLPLAFHAAFVRGRVVVADELIAASAQRFVCPFPSRHWFHPAAF